MTLEYTARVLTALGTVSLLTFGMSTYYLYNLLLGRDAGLLDLLVFQGMVGFQAFVISSMLYLRSASKRNARQYRMELHWRAYYNREGQAVRPGDRYLLTPLGTVLWHDGETVDMTDVGGTIIPGCTTIQAASEVVVTHLRDRYQILSRYMGQA